MEEITGYFYGLNLLLLILKNYIIMKNKVVERIELILFRDGRYVLEI